MPNLQKPTPALVHQFQQKFQEEGYSITDNALAKLLVAFPKNNRIEDVWLKAAALNSLYSTGILAVYQVAEHIYRQGIDDKLDKGLPEVVNEIAPTEIRGKVRRNYSFASKYCSWHQPDAYPMYDSYVEQLIWAYQKADRFSVFKRCDLQDYTHYKAVIEQFQQHYGLTDFRFKELDRFLWLYGKQLFERKSGK